MPELTAEQVVNQNLLYQFEDLYLRYPDPFIKYYGDFSAMTSEEKVQKCADALRVGRKVYTGEGCWHCHSQYIRPVARETDRWGPVSTTPEYNNELQRPVMFGTRRVGPDLSREAGRRGNDWHTVHFLRPQALSEGSPMPNYPWFFDKNKETGKPDSRLPNERGIAIITYIQWLGSQLEEYPTYEDYRSRDEQMSNPLE